jgi:hypothetical protein
MRALLRLHDGDCERHDATPPYGPRTIVRAAHADGRRLRRELDPDAVDDLLRTLLCTGWRVTEVRACEPGSATSSYRRPHPLAAGGARGRRADVRVHRLPTGARRRPAGGLRATSAGGRPRRGDARAPELWPARRRRRRAVRAAARGAPRDRDRRRARDAHRARGAERPARRRRRSGRGRPRAARRTSGCGRGRAARRVRELPRDVRRGPVRCAPVGTPQRLAAGLA